MLNDAKSDGPMDYNAFMDKYANLPGFVGRGDTVSFILNGERFIGEFVRKDIEKMSDIFRSRPHLDLNIQFGVLRDFGSHFIVTQPAPEVAALRERWAILGRRGNRSLERIYMVAETNGGPGAGKDACDSLGELVVVVQRACWGDAVPLEWFFKFCELIRVEPKVVHAFAFGEMKELPQEDL